MVLTGVKHNFNGFPISINDIRDKYFAEIPLTEEEEVALKNYDSLRMEYLNSAPSEDVFESRYIELQAKANLAPFTDFLDLSKYIWDQGILTNL